jgi:hypothetical protein
MPAGSVVTDTPTTTVYRSAGRVSWLDSAPWGRQPAAAPSVNVKKNFVAQHKLNVIAKTESVVSAFKLKKTAANVSTKHSTDTHATSAVTTAAPALSNIIITTATTVAVLVDLEQLVHSPVVQ